MRDNERRTPLPTTESNATLSPAQAHMRVGGPSDTPLYREGFVDTSAQSAAPTMTRRATVHHTINAWVRQLRPRTWATHPHAVVLGVIAASAYATHVAVATMRHWHSPADAPPPTATFVQGRGIAAVSAAPEGPMSPVDPETAAAAHGPEMPRAPARAPSPGSTPSAMTDSPRSPPFRARDSEPGGNAPTAPVTADSNATSMARQALSQDAGASPAALP